MMVRLFLLAVALALPLTSVQGGWDPLQKAERAAQAGAAALAAGDTLAAIDSYLKAQALAPEDPDIKMAVGDAFYTGGEYRASLGQYRGVSDPAEPALAAQSLYNAGNSAFSMGDLRQALDLYTQALVVGGADEDVAYNLELTQKLLEQSESDDSQEGEQSQDQESEDQQEQQENEEQQQEQQQQEQQQEQQQQEQQQQEQENQQNEEEQPQDEGEQEEQQEEEPPQAPPDSTAAPEPAPADSLLALPEGMTPEEAMRLLDALDHDEEELRKSIQRRLRGTDTKSTHDW